VCDGVRCTVLFIRLVCTCIPGIRQSKIKGHSTMFSSHVGPRYAHIGLGCSSQFPGALSLLLVANAHTSNNIVETPTPIKYFQNERKFVSCTD